MYYASELSYKVSNPLYTPPRFLNGTAEGMTNVMIFQEADLEASNGLTELSADLTMADYLYPGRGIPLSVLQSKSRDALKRCGLQEVPGIAEWCHHEV